MNKQTQKTVLSAFCLMMAFSACKKDNEGFPTTRSSQGVSINSFYAKEIDPLSSSLLNGCEMGSTHTIPIEIYGKLGHDGTWYKYSTVSGNAQIYFTDCLNFDVQASVPSTSAAGMHVDPTKMHSSFNRNTCTLNLTRMDPSIDGFYISIGASEKVGGAETSKIYVDCKNKTLRTAQ